MYNIKNKYSLYDYQQKITSWMKLCECDGHGGILAVDMGLGKTLISLHHIFSNMRKANSLSLVIVPKTLLSNWNCDGIKKFYPKVNALFYHADILGRKKFEDLHENFLQDFTSYDIVITTYDVCSSLFKRKPNNFLFTVKWERIICDESHKLSNSRTGKFKTLLIMKSNFNWCLTGTPIWNSIKGLFNQLQFCGFGKIRTHQEYYAKELDKVIYKLKYKDTNKTLPKKNVSYHNVKMDKNQRKIYNSYASGVKTRVNGIKFKPDSKIVLETFLRLRQICISPSLMDNVKKFINTEKIKKIEEIVNDIPSGEKIVIFSMFKKSLDLILDVLGKKRCLKLTGDVRTIRDRQVLLRRFRKSERKNILLINYKIGGEGLDITSANHVLFVEPWWNDATQEQALARVRRLGQEKEVNVHYVLNKDTIEMNIMEMCKNKSINAKALMSGKYETDKVEYKLTLSEIKGLI